MLDGLSTSVAVKAPCATVATSNISLSGLQTINSVLVAEGDRVLVTAQTDATENGIYTASTGAWIRALDADGDRDLVRGTRVLVRSDTIAVEYELVTDDPISIGSSSLNFELRYGANVSYDISLIEIAAGVTPADESYEVLDPRRYATVANWTAVFNQVDTLLESFSGWYRGDRAQHPTLTNAIVGFQAFNDAALSGTVGYRTTAFGCQALKLNGQSTLAGGSGCAFGYGALQNSIDNSGCSAFGALALNSLPGTPGSDLYSHHNAFGYRVLSSLVNGVQNNGFGFETYVNLLRGNNNHGFGESCGYALIAGSGNIKYGYQSGYSQVGGSFSHSFGYQAAFNETASVITGITQAASAVITISTVSTINPFSAGQPVVVVDVSGMTQINEVTGIVSAIGGSSGAWTVTVGINSSGFSAYTSGGYLAPHGNLSTGFRAGFNLSRRGGNTFTGADVCQSAEPGYGNTVGGYQAGNALNCNTGSGDGAELNTLYGFWSGLRITSGASNANYGNRSGENITTGSENTCIGPNSGNGVSTADRNAWCGSGTAVNLNGDLNSGLGYNAGTQASAQAYTNTTNLGANSTCTGSNQLQLGSTGVTSYSFGAVQDRSDVRDKADVRPTELGLSFINLLRPVDYRWDFRADYDGEKDGSKKRARFHHGLIAQEVKQVADSLGLDFGGYQDHKIAGGQDVLSLGYAELIAPLIKAVQELSAKVAELEAERRAARRAQSIAINGSDK